MQQNQDKDLIIAIDGFSSCGKSTLAKALANTLDYIYIDTGAMYRAVTLYLLRNDIPIADQDQIQASLSSIHITFKREPELVTYLNGVCVESQIRSLEVSDHVSEVSTIASVREHVVALQKKMGTLKRIVMEGRDIGTVVFPNAEIKIFLTADVDVRVERRYSEVLRKGLRMTREDVRKNLIKRDRIDSTRAHSPLVQAEDALLIDNSHLTIQDQVEMIIRLVEKA